MEVKNKISYTPVVMDEPNLDALSSVGTISASLAALPFVALDIATTTLNETIGWVFSDESLVNRAGSYLLLKARQDRLVIPEKLVKLKLAEAERAFKQENGVEAIPKTQKAEIKEEVLTKLRPQGLIVPSFVDVVLDPETNIFLIMSRTASEVLSVASLLERSFDNSPMSVLGVLSGQNSEELMRKLLNVMMYAGEVSANGRDYTLTLAGEAVLKIDKLKVTLTCSQEGTVYQFLGNKLDSVWPGSVVDKLRISMVLDGDEYVFTVKETSRCQPEQLSVTSSLVPQDKEEALVAQLDQVLNLQKQFPIILEAIGRGTLDA